MKSKFARPWLQTSFIAFLLVIFGSACPCDILATDRLVFEPDSNQATTSTPAKHIVLVAGDEEYRTEESMPMLAKILSKKHGFKCTVIFSMGPDGADYIDPNNSAGLRGLETLRTADLMLIGTRFREPSQEQSQHVTDFLNAGKPVIGIRTATHAFKGKGSFGGVGFGDFGLKILGETWVSHHGQHKKQGGRGIIEKSQASHAILRGVQDVFTPSDIYGVVHLSDADTILMRGAVTESLDPKSPNITGEKNDVLQPFAWLHSYQRPLGNGTGTSFCTTGGASVDFVSEDFRRLVVNAALHLTGREVPEKADVAFVDRFYPSFYGFIKEPEYWKKTNLKSEDFGLGKSRQNDDPPGSPEWPYRDSQQVAR
jgi:Trehalose utilisation